MRVSLMKSGNGWGRGDLSSWWLRKKEKYRFNVCSMKEDKLKGNSEVRLFFKFQIWEVGIRPHMLTWEDERTICTQNFSYLTNRYSTLRKKSSIIFWICDFHANSIFFLSNVVLRRERHRIIRTCCQESAFINVPCLAYIC